MHAFINPGIDRARTPSIVLRPNVEPVEFGRCVVVVAKMDGDEPGSGVTGVKQINCFTQGAGQAKIARPGKKPMLDAAFKVALDELDRLDKNAAPDSKSDRNRIGNALLACLTSEGNDWPEGTAELIEQCAA